MDWYRDLIQVLPQFATSVLISAISAAAVVAIAKVWVDYSNTQSIARFQDNKTRVQELKAINTQVLAIVQQNAEAITKMSGAVEMVARALDANNAALAQNTNLMQVLVARAA